MKVPLNPHRHHAGGFALGVLVLVAVTVAIIGIFILASTAKSIKPRTLPPEETNSFYFYNRVDSIYYASIPQQPPPPPSMGHSPDYCVHTNAVTFLWDDHFWWGHTVIERTEDGSNWVVLNYLLFEEPIFTNGYFVQPFVDLYAPADKAFYRGLVLTNGIPPQ